MNTNEKVKATSGGLNATLNFASTGESFADRAMIELISGSSKSNKPILPLWKNRNANIRRRVDTAAAPTKRHTSIQFFAVQCGCQPGTQTTVQTERCLTVFALCQRHLGLQEFAPRIAVRDEILGARET